VSIRLLALTPPGSSEALAGAALASALELVEAPDLTSLFQHLSDGAWAATLLSLSIEPVDEAVARRIAQERNSGTLLLSARTVSLERALLMERTGAVALLREPIQESEITSRLVDVAEQGAEIPVPAPSTGNGAGQALVGTSPAMASVFEVVARVARSPATVLITGDSGTGKEVTARAIHSASDRKDAPFVAVNCAAIPEHLLESELFGHERGAFTGAVAQRIGRFERAHGGTLFLDEIGDMSLVLQAKILRILEERVLERVGGEESMPIEVRVIAATNQDLSGQIEAGQFREDLYYRLAVVELHLPPLRVRGEDIRALALHLIAQFAARYNRPVEAISEDALARLEEYAWPGNVRELRNVLDRAVLLANGSVIRSGQLRLGIGSPRASARSEDDGVHRYPPTLSLDEVEADHILRVLSFAGGHMGKAAGILGIHRNTLTRKVQEHGIEVEHPTESPE